MADNVQLNGVSVVGGAVIATDEVGGVQHQYVKLEFGDDGTATKVSSADPLPVAFSESAASATETTVSASASSVQLLAANANRKSVLIRNDSEAIMYISHGGTATTSSPVMLQPQSIWEMGTRYVGALNAIWESAVGSAQILEFA